MGREHEDLVLVTGRLASDVPFNCIVDWLTPTKRRQSRILGERGMLVADTLTADLTLYHNGSVTSEWSSAQALRGVSEGDATRFALSRREPLLVELEAFCDLLAGDDGRAGRDRSRRAWRPSAARRRCSRARDAARASLA